MTSVALRPVADDDLPAIFEQMRDPAAVRMAGRGIATRALTLLLAEVPARPVFARAAADNEASLRVLAKAGFAVGTERSYAPARGAEIDETVLRLDR